MSLSSTKCPPPIKCNPNLGSVHLILIHPSDIFGTPEARSTDRCGDSMPLSAQDISGVKVEQSVSCPAKKPRPFSPCFGTRPQVTSRKLSSFEAVPIRHKTTLIRDPCSCSAIPFFIAIHHYSNHEMELQYQMKYSQIPLKVRGIVKRTLHPIKKEIFFLDPYTYRELDNYFDTKSFLFDSDLTFMDCNKESGIIRIMDSTKKKNLLGYLSPDGELAQTETVCRRWNLCHAEGSGADTGLAVRKTHCSDLFSESSLSLWYIII